MLRRAHDSVMGQTHACTHYMVADGHPQPDVDSWSVRHIVLPVEHRNNGNTPRAIGSLDAMGDGFDAIAYLDADNWFEPDHIEGLVWLHRDTGSDFLTSGRVIHGLDGRVLLEHGDDGDGERHADTSTALVTKRGFALLPVWSLMPNELGANCDRIFFTSAKRLGLKMAHDPAPTLHFTSGYSPHYRAANVPVPPEAQAMAKKKLSDDYLREVSFLGCSDPLNPRALQTVLAQRTDSPGKVLLIIGGDKADPKLEEVKTVIGHAFDHDVVEVVPLQDLLDVQKFKAGTLNTFALALDDVVDSLSDVERANDQRPDIKFVYVRSDPSLKPGQCNSALDQRAWRVLTYDPNAPDLFHQENRYGSGHVSVIEHIADIAGILRSGGLQVVAHKDKS